MFNPIVEFFNSINQTAVPKLLRALATAIGDKDILKDNLTNYRYDYLNEHFRGMNDNGDDGGSKLF